MSAIVLFLSPLRDDATEINYSTDRSFDVSGTQTNEAPTEYILKRERGNVSKIFAFISPTAINSGAWQHYSEKIMNISVTDKKSAQKPVKKFDKRSNKKQNNEKHENEIAAKPELIPIEVADDASVVDLIKIAIDRFEDLNSDDEVIIETTGGSRNAVNALSLFARFLIYRRITIKYSTYSDFQAKKVSTTEEVDSLTDLLNVVSGFTKTGNPDDLVSILSKPEFRAIEGSKEFISAATEFYDVLLCNKMKSLPTVIPQLQKALDMLLSGQLDSENIKVLMFRKIVAQFVKDEMSFINSNMYLVDFVLWCCKRDYISQAVIVLNDSVVKGSNDPRIKRMRDKTELLQKYRNDIAHADEKNTTHIRASQLRDFVREICIKIKDSRA
ncbi:hypothetical protein FACS1894105_00550 [Clostridia bacterium]|nr:hypothetical protein FACS1894105_00550 [Clostridia bacterium]